MSQTPSVYYCLLVVFSSGLVSSLPSSEKAMRVMRVTNNKGDLERTVFLPFGGSVQDEDDGYVLISDSSMNKFKEQEKSGKRKVIKRRRRKKPAWMMNKTLPTGNLTSLKDPKFLNLFTIVKFGNDDCGEGGTCYHEAECRQLGGTPQGPCARGFGVCCILEVKCGETTRRTASVFQGSTAQGACSLNIEKAPCTRQIRLDFYSLELEAPQEGNCISDRLLVAGQNVNNIVPILCGSNSGQHMNIDVDESTGPIMVSVISPSKKDFKMKVTQLCENDPLLAPRGCLQYFIDNSGVIQSFNYGEADDNSTYLNNLNYAMCIRKQPGMCSVEYSNMDESGDEFRFDINNIDLDGDATVPEGEAGAEVFNCPEDYLTIAGVRLCGQRFNDATSEADFTKSAPVYDKSNGPIILSFVSSPSIAGKGFRLNYQQQPC